VGAFKEIGTSINGYYEEDKEEGKNGYAGDRESTQPLGETSDLADGVIPEKNPKNITKVTPE